MYQNREIQIKNQMVCITTDHYDHIYSLLTNGLKYSDREICKQLRFGNSTLSSNKKNKRFTPFKVNFFLKGLEYIEHKYSHKYTFNLETGKFTEHNENKESEFHNGIYYGYFYIPRFEKIKNVILQINRKTVIMWTNQKKAFGEITYSGNNFIILLSSKNDKNDLEFFIGRRSSNKDIKYFIATYRNREDEVFSTVCIIKHQPDLDPGLLNKIDQINLVKLKSDIISKKPTFVDKFFKDNQLTIDLNLINHDFE